MTGDVVEEKEAAPSAETAARAGRKTEKTAGTPSDSSVQPEVKPGPSSAVPAATSIPFEWAAIKVHPLAPAPPCMFDRSLEGLAACVRFRARKADESRVLSTLEGRRIHATFSRDSGAIQPCARFASANGVVSGGTGTINSTIIKRAIIAADGKVIPIPVGRDTDDPPDAATAMDRSRLAYILI